MNNSINHKFHHISRAEYQELLAVSRGDAVADYIIDNVSILDLINGGEISGPIVIKGRYIAGVGAEYADAPALQRIDARGATAVPGFIAESRRVAPDDARFNRLFHLFLAANGGGRRRVWAQSGRFGRAGGRRRRL